MLLTSDSLKKLKQGNKRFVDQLQGATNPHAISKKYQLVTDKQPIAIVIGCSDSRVPPEIIFDQALGDLFVIRVAGNVITPTQLGSVEYAVQMFNIPLIVVLGHSHCRCIMSTLDVLDQTEEKFSSNIHAIFEVIRPSIEPLYEAAGKKISEELIHDSVKTHALASGHQLKTASPSIASMVEQNKLTIMSSLYSLESGEVTFLNED